MSGLRFESMADMPPRMRELYARQQIDLSGAAAPAPLRKGSQGRGLCRGGVVRSKRYCCGYSSIFGCQAQEVLLEFNILLISHGT